MVRWRNECGRPGWGGGRSGVGNGAEDRRAEGKKRDGGMEKWVRPGGQEKKLGGFVYYFADKRGGYCGLFGGDGRNEPVREQRRQRRWCG